MDNIQSSLLEQVNFPSDLRTLAVSDLPKVCDELRSFIIEMVSRHTGHFGANLATIELATALHYVFDTPEDKIVWDVGHQAYAHKILTGRKAVFHTNRKHKGISGFPRREESEYDAFGTGHSSTSISAILGMAIAAQLTGNLQRQHIAVIGDGALTAGQAFEALNHAGVTNVNITIILNDNGMSIDLPTGALNDHLRSLIFSKESEPNSQYFINSNLQLDGRTSPIKKGSYRTRHSNNFFESLNIRYVGPVNGHDVATLTRILNESKQIYGPKLIHVVTTKGKGYPPAEKEQTRWHFPGIFDRWTGEIQKPKDVEKVAPKYQDVFGYTLVELALLNETIVAITPAMLSGSSLKLMMDRFPERTFDVGICEQHAVTFSAGLATQKLTVFCNIYSSFLQRGYDQFIHDVVIQKIPVIMCLDRGGLVGEDGATHHGIFDIAYCRCLPGVIICSPMNEPELRNLMYTAQLGKINQPLIIRYPRGQGVTVEWKQPFSEINIGTGRIIREGLDVAILTFGHTGNFALDACNFLAADGIFPGLFDMRFIKPLDHQLLHHIFQKYSSIITVEDGCILGGLGSAVTEFMVAHRYVATIRILGVPDQIIEHGPVQDLYRECRFDREGIISTVREILNNESANKEVIENDAI